MNARADNTADAKAHFDAGQRAFADGDYTTAVDELNTAYRLQPHPDVLINIATCYERLYKPSEAREHYERFLTDAPEESPLRALANNRLRVLRALPGSILVDSSKPGASVHLVGEGRDLTGVTPKTSHFRDLPPGRYKMHVELGYHVPHDVEVTLEPGGQDVVNVQLEHQVETLTVFSKPDGARVFLDDREEGITPFSRPVDVGMKRRLRLEAEDFPAHNEEIDVLPGKPMRKNIVFKRALRSGRTELVLGSMIFGGAGAASIAEIAGGPKLDGNARLGIDIAASVVGVGIGLLVATLTTDDYVKIGHSSIILGSTVWGTTIGIALSYGLFSGDQRPAPFNRDRDQNTLALGILGGGLGMGAGLLIAHYSNPSSGDSAIVNSGGTWGTATGLLIAQSIAYGSDADRNTATGWLTLSGLTIGVVTSAFLARAIEVSRGHVALVDTFGLAGLALAFAVGYGVAPSEAERVETGSRYGLGGVAVGLLAGALLSRRYKDDLPPAEALVTHHGGRWAVGMPQLRVGQAMAPEGRDTRLTFDLARGEF
jgi:PEGA domain